jgi:hypothetical protein
VDTTKLLKAWTWKSQHFPCILLPKTVQKASQVLRVVESESPLSTEEQQSPTAEAVYTKVEEVFGLSLKIVFHILTFLEIASCLRPVISLCLGRLLFSR